MAGENETRNSLSNAIASLRANINPDVVIDIIDEMRELANDQGIAIGKEQALAISAAVDKFSLAINMFYKGIAESFVELQTSTDDASKSWKAKEQPLKLDIENKRSELEAKGVKLDMAHIARLTQQESQYKANLDKLKTWIPHLTQRKEEYAEALRARWLARKAVSNARQRYAIKASKALAEVLDDLQVKLIYAESAYSQEAVTIIANAMGWKAVSHAKAKAMVSQLTLPGLLSALEKMKTAPLQEVMADGVKMFSPADVRGIMAALSEPTVMAALEKCEVNDLPKLTVTKKADDPVQVRFIHKDFTQLSLGQQQSVLLALILSSDSKRPLIIDQPEDNLDSEFIVHTFVPVLRRAKERRQVVIVTHNANIAVLGDAEQLIVLKSTSEKSMIVARGSIDDEKARVAACKILEGAREAFLRRAKIYGVIK